jgi:hypothetical protein
MPHTNWYGKSNTIKSSFAPGGTQKNLRLSLEKPANFSISVDNKKSALQDRPSIIDYSRSDSREPIVRDNFQFIKEEEKDKSTRFYESLKTNESFFSRLENKLKMDEDSSDLDRE